MQKLLLNIVEARARSHCRKTVPRKKKFQALAEFSERQFG